MKKTNIIVTLGPSSDDPKMIKKLIKAGTNVFRLNFSHGSFEEHKKRIKNLRAIEKETKRPVTILQDLQGPKIRVGDIPGDSLELENGKDVVLTVEKPKRGEIPVQYKGFYKDVKKGDRILFDDGTLELKAISKNKKKVTARVITGGMLHSKKGINLPNSDVCIDVISKKDKEDLRFGLKYDVDYVALSFVKTGKDIEDLRRIIKKEGKNTKIIAKIERHEAIDDIENIISKADGIMVARGDLGVETSLEEVPMVQKDIIKKCVAHGIPVIVATQMLDSMIRNPHSTRAEASDIANAILDGADAVMLSGETSVGKYPLNAVNEMRKIALKVEGWVARQKRYIGRSVQKEVTSTADAIAKSASIIISDLDAKLIINATASGETTRAISKFRPYVPIISLTHTLKTARELELVWGVIPYVISYKDITDMIDKALKIAKDYKLVKKGDKVVIISGQKIGVVGGTNMIKIKEV